MQKRLQTNAEKPYECCIYLETFIRRWLKEKRNATESERKQKQLLISVSSLIYFQTRAHSLDTQETRPRDVRMQKIVLKLNEKIR